METLQEINRRLHEIYGELDNKPHFRVVWSDDQFEKALIHTTKEGFQLLTPIVQEVLKYPYLKSVYILESLMEVAIQQQHEIPEFKLSYECIWAFHNVDNQPVRPSYGACKFVVETVMGNISKRGVYTKYKEVTEEIKERERKELDEVTQQLYGNETPVGDALAHRYGISMSGSKSTQGEN